MRRAMFTAVVVLVAAVQAGAAPAVGSWTREPSLLQPRAAHAVVVAGGSIFAIGGTGRQGAPVLTVERFDGREWKVETRLPSPGGLNAPAAAVIGSRIYVVGGFEGTGNAPTARVDVYNLATKSWSRAAPLPSARGGHAAVVLNGRIHVLGGGNDVSTLAMHSIYDPAADRWTSGAPLRRPKGSPAAAVRDGRIYVVGGRSGFSDYGDVEIYAAAADRWTEGPAIVPRGAAGAAAYGRSLYVFGGESQKAGRTLADVLRLRPGATAWERVAPMPTKRAFARGVPFRGSVYVVGGSTVTASSHAAQGTGVVERLTIPPGSR